MEEESDVTKGGVSRGQNSCVISPLVMRKDKGREAPCSSLSPPAARSEPAGLPWTAPWLSTAPGNRPGCVILGTRLTSPVLLCELDNNSTKEQGDV